MIFPQILVNIEYYHAENEMKFVTSRCLHISWLTWGPSSWMSSWQWRRVLKSGWLKPFSKHGDFVGGYLQNGREVLSDGIVHRASLRHQENIHPTKPSIKPSRVCVCVLTNVIKASYCWSRQEDLGAGKTSLGLSLHLRNKQGPLGWSRAWLKRLVGFGHLYRHTSQQASSRDVLSGIGE